MRCLAAPSNGNDYYAKHIEILIKSFERWTGRSLINSKLKGTKLGREVFFAPFALVSHNSDDDPVFNYGNKTALRLFEMNWDELTALPSRLSANAGDQQQRDELLAEVTRNGFIADYQGIRVSRTKQRFLIKNAIIWNLLDGDEQYYGQAALFDDWRHLAED